MSFDHTAPHTAFAGHRQIASGALSDVLTQAKAAFDLSGGAHIDLLNDQTGDFVEVDLHGEMDAVLARLNPVSPDAPEAKRAGRPKLGVVAREVTLLPRHWDWLASQPEGASAALRKLVEDARKDVSGRDRARRSERAADKFMRRMGGNLPLFEDAYRAFYAKDDTRMAQLIAAWPADVRDYLGRLVKTARRDAADVT